MLSKKNKNALLRGKNLQKFCSDANIKMNKLQECRVEQINGRYYICLPKFDAAERPERTLLKKEAKEFETMMLK